MRAGTAVKRASAALVREGVARETAAAVVEVTVGRMVRVVTAAKEEAARVAMVGERVVPVEVAPAAKMAVTMEAMVDIAATVLWAMAVPMVARVRAKAAAVGALVAVAGWEEAAEAAMARVMARGWAVDLVAMLAALAAADGLGTARLEVRWEVTMAEVAAAVEWWERRR